MGHTEIAYLAVVGSAKFSNAHTMQRGGVMWGRSSDRVRKMAYNVINIWLYRQVLQKPYFTFTEHTGYDYEMEMFSFGYIGK